MHLNCNDATRHNEVQVKKVSRARHNAILLYPSTESSSLTYHFSWSGDKICVRRSVVSLAVKVDFEEAFSFVFSLSFRETRLAVFLALKR